MKRTLTIISAIAFSGVALSAQNNADTIKVCRNESDTIVVIVKEKPAYIHQTGKLSGTDHNLSNLLNLMRKPKPLQDASAVQ